MEIILKQDISNLGFKDDVIEVKNGYGRNYLIPKGYAVLATESAKKVHAENLKQRAHKEAKLKDEASVIAEKITALSLKIGAKASSKGKIFGSVNSIQLSEALAKEGIEVDRKKIVVKADAIKEVGEYTAVAKLHREVSAEIKFEVIAE